MMCIIFLLGYFHYVNAAANLKDAFGIMLHGAATEAGYQTTSDGMSSIDQMIGDVINLSLSFLGVIFLILMIYGGYLWMTARGNEQQVEKSKNLITAAIIGLIIVLAAYAISATVISIVAQKTLTGGGQ